MPILNDSLTWAALPDNGGQTRAQIHSAFVGGVEKILLPVDFALCKVHNYPTLSGNMAPSAVISGWWTALNRFRDDTGLHDRVKLAGVLGVSVRELSRVFLAVRENWNSFKYLAMITLSQPVYAFYGGVAAQARIDKGQASLVQSGEDRGATAKLPGRGKQIYIPYLTVGHTKHHKVIEIAGIERAAGMGDKALQEILKFPPA
ncbi:MAG: hypothetical protein ACK5AZ_22810 [Bryobacteraceae bacterium]